MSTSEGGPIFQEDNDAQESAALLIRTTGEELLLSNSEQLYIDSGNGYCTWLLCIGLLNHNNEPLFSFEKEPWSLLPKTLLLRPNNVDSYVNKIALQAIYSAASLYHGQVIGLNTTRFKNLLILNSSQMKCQGWKVC